MKATVWHYLCSRINSGKIKRLNELHFLKNLWGLPRMAEWGGWQILSLKSKLAKIDKNNLSELWDLTRGITKYDKLLCLKTAELQVRTVRVCGAISEGCSHLPTAQLMCSSCRNVVWGRLGGPETVPPYERGLTWFRADAMHNALYVKATLSRETQQLF